MQERERDIYIYINTRLVLVESLSNPVEPLNMLGHGCVLQLQYRHPLIQSKTICIILRELQPIVINNYFDDKTIIPAMLYLASG